MSSNQHLPPKEQAAFRSIVKYYESKQYRKGIKAADAVLKKFPQHGETLCMKGLTLSYLDRKEEAYELVRQGLKLDLRSHVCWHVYGLLYRSDRNYHEAVKCYLSALRIEPDNLQILRDLSLLQIQQRDLQGFCKTRKKLLQLKSNQRVNWIGYAVAEHLCQNHELAVLVLDSYENSFGDAGESITKFEKSEVQLYKCQILEEGGKYAEAIEALKSPVIVDKIAALEARARLAFYVGDLDLARATYAKLVDINPENHAHVLALMASQAAFQDFFPAPGAPGSNSSTARHFPDHVHKDGVPKWGWLEPTKADQDKMKPENKFKVIGNTIVKDNFVPCSPTRELTEAEQKEVLNFFGELRDKHSRADALLRIPLHFITGELFSKRLDSYLRGKIRKGVPSLFRLIKSLYALPNKAETIEKLVLGYIHHLTTESAFEENGDPESPVALLFSYMLMAQHADLLGRHADALEWVDKAIAHTPTMVELYTLKGSILKHAGAFEESALSYEQARKLDLADRYPNSLAVKAMLRADDIDKANSTVLLFSREPDSPDSANLHDMQCMWYELAVSRSLYRQQKYGRSLRKLSETFKHFQDITEDQFDFHNYCLRKNTLRAYIGLLGMQDRLYSHKFFRRAAKDAINLYLEFVDEPTKRGQFAVPQADVENMTAAERKKLKMQMKREQQKQAKSTAVAEAASKDNKGKRKEEDPAGLKLLEKEPLPEAVELVKKLLRFAQNDIHTHKLAFDVYSRKGRPLLCLQALYKLKQFCGDRSHPALAPRLIHFMLTLTEMPGVAFEVVLAELSELVGRSLKSLQDVKECANAIMDEVVAARATYGGKPAQVLLGALRSLASRPADAAEVLRAYEVNGAAPKFKALAKVCTYVKTVLPEEYPAFAAKCRVAYPLAEL